MKAVADGLLLLLLLTPLLLVPSADGLVVTFNKDDSVAEQRWRLLRERDDAEQPSDIDDTSTTGELDGDINAEIDRDAESGVEGDDRVPASHDSSEATAATSGLSDGPSTALGMDHGKTIELRVNAAKSLATAAEDSTAAASQTRSSEIVTGTDAQESGSGTSVEPETNDASSSTYLHDHDERFRKYDHPWPAVADRDDADFVEDTNQDDGSWAAFSKYNQLRHAIGEARTQMQAAHSAIPPNVRVEEATRKTLQSKRKRDREQRRLLDDAREEEVQKIERLSKVKSRTRDEKRDLAEKRRLLDKMREDQQAELQRLEEAKKKWEKRVQDGDEEVKKAEENFAAVEKMLKSSTEYQKAEADADAAAERRKELASQYEAAERELEAAKTEHEHASRVLYEARENAAESRAVAEKMNADLHSSHADLAKYSSSDTNPWTGLMGGDTAEDEVPTPPAITRPIVIYLVGSVLLLFAGFALGFYNKLAPAAAGHQ
ncbi:unnamed protein product [Amoebophrya sp. A25]|nr:unnamed protein product [Amoebophrya sp. A25]|eukprot:GSA25T00005055001.1